MKFVPICVDTPTSTCPIESHFSFEFGENYHSDKPASINKSVLSKTDISAIVVSAVVILVVIIGVIIYMVSCIYINKYFFLNININYS